MNEKLMESAGEVLELLTPGMAQELIQWKRWQYSVVAVALIATSYLLLLIAKKCYKKHTERGKSYDEGLIGAAILCYCAMAVCIVAAVINAALLLQVCVAPRVYLLEYFASVIK